MDLFFFAVMVLIFGANIHINIFSRFFAGFIGFYINGYLVFKTLKSRSARQQFYSAIKFIILLSAMTTISSFFLNFFTHTSGLYFIAAKAIIEIILATISFLIQKNFVYKDGSSFH